MRPPQPLPEAALKELAALLKQCKDKATYQRVQCVWLRAALGLSAPPVAQALGWSLSAVHHVQARYLREGSAVLFGPGRGGRAHANLSVAQEQQLLADFAVPAAQGGVVEAGPVRTAYEAAVGRTVPKSTVYRLLMRHGWRKLAPRPRHVAASRAAQEAFKKSFDAWYAPKCSAKGRRAVRLMFQDEARFGRMQDPRRAWAPPGVRPLVPTEIVREYGYAYAAVSPHDGVLDSLVLPDVNAERMSLFLAEVARRPADEFILMVLDGAGWHTARELIVPERMRLYPLPARSPELNPAEHLWDEVREKWLCNRFFDCQEAVDAQVARGLAALERDPARVASLAGFSWITAIPLTAP